MDSIRHLLPQDGRDIFDPEELTIEILAHRLQDLVKGDHLNVLQLGPMRALAREVAGRPKEDDPDGIPLPEALPACTASATTGFPPSTAGSASGSSSATWD